MPNLYVSVCIFLFYILFTFFKCSKNLYNHICHGQNDKYDWTIVKYVTMLSYFNYVVVEDDISEGKWICSHLQNYLPIPWPSNHPLQLVTTNIIVHKYKHMYILILQTIKYVIYVWHRHISDIIMILMRLKFQILIILILILIMKLNSLLIFET